MDRLLRSTAPAAIICIRLAAGAVFLTEGIQKFLFPAALGVGRFTKIGIPGPQFFAPFVGVVEIVCGTLLLAGLLTRLAAIPLVIDMIVAIASTKIPLLVKSGFWAFSHESRTDVAMILSAICLGIVGAGPWALDARLAQLLGTRKSPQLAV
jgi:putative oxidoreductase